MFQDFLNNTKGTVNNTTTGLMNTPSGLMNTTTGLMNTPTGLMNTTTGLMNTPTGLMNTTTGLMNTPTGLMNNITIPQYFSSSTPVNNPPAQPLPNIMLSNPDLLLKSNYPYYKNIKTPKELGISSTGDLNTLDKDISGLTEYVKLLVSGDSKASVKSNLLGNKYFLNTGAKCRNTSDNTLVDRYIYINNVPQENIPIISDAVNAKFTDFKGLLPGTISNLNALNPFSMMDSFKIGNNPQCQEITMETIDNNNAYSTETHYVTMLDIQNMNACNFANKINPITNSKCQENFKCNLNYPSDLLTQLYFTTLMILVLYFIYKLAT